MAMDRSHDSRSAADARTRQDEIDPWSEFLSESPDEVQQSADGARDSGYSAHRDQGVTIVPLQGDDAASVDGLLFASELDTPSPGDQRSSMTAGSHDPVLSTPS